MRNDLHLHPIIDREVSDLAATFHLPGALFNPSDVSEIIAAGIQHELCGASSIPGCLFGEPPPSDSPPPPPGVLEGFDF